MSNRKISEMTADTTPAFTDIVPTVDPLLGPLPTANKRPTLSVLFQVNVRHYGATGNGTVDDTVAIQAAIDVVNAASGGLVFFPAGLYQISSTLTVGDATTLSGEGQRSQIRAVNALEADMLINKDIVGGNFFIEIQNVAFDGNRTGQLATGGILRFDNVNDFSIHDCWFSNAFNDAVFIDNAFFGRIVNNFSRGPGADSYTIHNTFDQIVSNNISDLAGATGTGGSGITVITSNGRLVIDGNICKGASNVNGSGIQVNGSSNCIITNNFCNGNAASGIGTGTGSGRHLISGNECLSNTLRGIFVLNNENVVTDNICNGNGSHGISILSPGQRNIISDNVFQNNGAAGIENDGAASTITGNICTLNNSQGIRIEADDCVVSNNICRDNSVGGAGSFSGIRVQDSDDGIYMGNRCFDTRGPKLQQYGIEEAGTSDRNTYIGNNLLDNLTDSAIFVGVNNTIKDNKGIDDTEAVTTTNVITAFENGKTFYLDDAGGFTSTLPAPLAGLGYTFIVTTAPTTSYIITTNAGADLLFGTFLDIVGELVYFSAQDTFNFVLNVSLVGDRLEVESDGTNWYCKAFSGADGGITVSVT